VRYYGHYLKNIMVTIIQLVALGIGLTGFLLVVLRQKPSVHYPPGPKGLPILGNIFDIPSEHPWIAYRKLSRLYSSYHPFVFLSMCSMAPESGILHMKFLQTHIIVLNSAAAAKELLEKRSALFSDRYINFVCAKRPDLIPQNHA
jgi:hypothetical protein